MPRLPPGFRRRDAFQPELKRTYDRAELIELFNRSAPRASERGMADLRATMERLLTEHPGERVLATSTDVVDIAVLEARVGFKCSRGNA